MELIDQHTKKIMEGCKERAWDAGLRFDKETLEYIVTNRDLLELTPKVMIPTLYDYWVHDVEVLKEKGRYELYPNNPYETVINTRPAISFYNDNNPDWLNVMIFYHVIGHIDFFQNNLFFRHTWNYDFTGTALSDKRMIAKLRAENGRWVDYIIEFTRSLDNLVGFHTEIKNQNQTVELQTSDIVDYYFDVFLQQEKQVPISKYIQEIDRFNQTKKDFGEKTAEKMFFDQVRKEHPEFDSLYQKFKAHRQTKRLDIIEFLLEHSPFLNKEDNVWMKSVMEVIRKTSLFFQPQIRTKIMNEGWASYWHENLFLSDDRIGGHEVDFARINAGVTAMPRVGLNPYALGMRLFYFIEESADKGRYSFDFLRLKNSKERKEYDRHTGQGRQHLFDIRENYNDIMFVNAFLNQDFMEKHKLFVAGKKLNQQRMTWQYYVKSRKAEDYLKMIEEQLYHPPSISVHIEKDGKTLYLNHLFEQKPLVRDFIRNTLIGVEFLWGGTVKLETSEVKPKKKKQGSDSFPGFKPQSAEEPAPEEIEWERVVYTVSGRKMEREVVD